MFDIFNQISGLLSGPFHNLAYGFEHVPILFAFLLGLVGAVAPCQLTSNISAITIYGNKSLVDKVPWLHIWLFVLGKIVVFSGIGIIIWLAGREINELFIHVFPVLRKAIGPLLVIIGLFMLGIFNVNKLFRGISLPTIKWKDSYMGSFLMGISFTLAFCPTMFILYIVTLMPIVLTTSYGVILPTAFGIGTSLPLLVVIFLIWYFGASGIILKKSRKIGAITQKIAGVLLIVIGLLDTITYWV